MFAGGIQDNRGRSPAVWLRVGDWLVTGRQPDIVWNGTCRRPDGRGANRQLDGCEIDKWTLSHEALSPAAGGQTQGRAALQLRAILDQIQHVPELLRALKLAVDRDRATGRGPGKADRQ